MTSKSGPQPGKSPPKTGLFRSRILDGIVYLSRRQAVVVVAVTAVLVGFSLYYIRDIPIRSSYLDLLPRQDPLIEKYRAKEEELTATDYAAILLSLTAPPEDAEEGKARLRTAADRLITILLRSPEITRASYRIGEEITYPEELLLFQKLTPEDLTALQESAEETMAVLSQLPPPEVQRLPALTGFDPAQLQLADTDQLLSQVEELVALGEAGLDVLGVLPQLQGPLHRAAEVIRRVEGAPARGTTPAGTELFSQDGTKLVLQVWPAQPVYTGLTYCQEIHRLLTEAVSQAELPDLGVEAAITGPYTMVTETNAVIRDDMNFTTWISSAGVLVLLSLTFASLSLTLVALFPLLVSALFTIAWAKLAVGGFNLVTTFLPALVLGLGIDFSIHLLARYVEERQAGRSVGGALAVAMRRKGEGSLAAALTTAGVFLALLVSRSRALEEMGVIMTMGIVVAFLAAMLLTPSLIVLGYVALRRRFREWIPFRRESLARGYRNLLLQRRAVVTITIGLTLALSYQVSQIEFRFASKQLAPRTHAAEVAQEILRELPGEVTFGDQFVFFVKDPAQLGTLEEALAENPLVTGIDSLRQLLPQELLRGKASLQDVPIQEMVSALEGLEAALSRWDELRRDLAQLAPALSSLEFVSLLAGDAETATRISGLLPRLAELHREMGDIDAPALLELARQLVADAKVIQEFLGRLAALPDEPGLLRALVEVLPEQLKEVYYSPTSQAFLLRAQMSPRLYEGDNLEAFVQWAQGLGVEFYGVPEVQARLEAYMKRDFAWSTGVAVFLIGLLVWRSFGRWREAALAISPLVIGYLWMLAGMRLMGIAFNFTNIVISPLLIGIGVDSAIHILHRIEEERRAGHKHPHAQGAAATLVPILSTSLTTMLVFGTLIAARTPGLRQLGISALLGLGFTLLASLLFLPCAAAWLDETRQGD